MSDRHSRTKPWRIGSFTKNFGWGEYKGTLKRIYDAIRIGFNNELKPVKRSDFRARIRSEGYVDLIPVNFFLFNQIIDGESYIIVDELVYQALSTEHSQQFDRLVTFALLLSEVGVWKGDFSPEQAQPSDWARYFVIDRLSPLPAWHNSDYSAKSIDSYLSGMKNFEGGTYKISRNLSYFFNSSNFYKLRDEPDGEWLPNSIFLALDRYYLIERPQHMSLGWCLDTLERNEVLSLTGPATEFKIFAGESSARLYSSVSGVERFGNQHNNSDDQIIAVLSRDPTLFKRLPAICAGWLSNRLFVELALSENEFEHLINTDFDAELRSSLERVHNSFPRPDLTGDEIIALFREDE